MAAKTYVSRLLALTMPLTLEDGKVHPVLFVNGEFTTDNKDVQEHIEATARFQTGVVTIKPSEIEAAKANAVSLRAAADAAVKAAVAAEAIVAKLSPIAQ